jgi:hypothetical protein
MLGRNRTALPSRRTRALGSAAGAGVSSRYAAGRMTELGGTRALVTGSTSGLGLAMARALADAGARVVNHEP